MKLNWFSPLPPAKTGIAHYTKRVLPALAARAQIILWTDQDEWDADLNRYAEVRHYQLQRMPWAQLNRASLSVYHIGNNPLFHGSVWQVSRRHPGLVALHDFRLHHFFDGLYRAQQRNLKAYLAVMERYYGEEGRRDAAACYKVDARNINQMAERYPLTLLAVENALSVLVHTEEAFADLSHEARWPVAYAPLPFAAPPRSSFDQVSNEGQKRAGSLPHRLIVFGYIGRNRRLEPLLEALAGFPERNQFHLDIYGEITDDKDILAQIQARGLKDLVTLRGFVPEAELDEALAASHLAVNLRYPTMGEASISQLRVWSHALPSLVTETGWYATLPADTVATVRPSHEVEDIRKHLNAYLADPSRFAAMGERGRAILEKNHAPEAYAQAVIDLAAKAQRFRPYTASYKLAERAGKLMGNWLEAKQSEESFRKVATEIYNLSMLGESSLS